MNGSISSIIKCAVLNYDIRAFHPCLLRVCSDGRHIVRRVFTATKITVCTFIIHFWLFQTSWKKTVRTLLQKVFCCQSAL
jgi:hypothetical protein